MYIIKISKYKNRNQINNDWTDYSDIGEEFNEVKLTESKYLEYENLYIKMIKLSLAFCSLSSLTINDFEEYRDINENLYCNLPINDFNYVFDIGMKLNNKLIELISRLSIRTQVWCELGDKKNNFKINFDEGLYFFIQTNNKMLFDFLKNDNDFNLLNISLTPPDFEL